MGVKKPGESDHDLAAIGEDEFDGLDDVGNAASRRITRTAVEGDRESAAVSAEDLDHLAPGCFAQFGTDGMRCWIEISGIEGHTISGKFHPELSNPICLIEYCNADVVSIRRDQITALGCDRYCWC